VEVQHAQLLLLQCQLMKVALVQELGQAQQQLGLRQERLQWQNRLQNPQHLLPIVGSLNQAESVELEC